MVNSHNLFYSILLQLTLLQARLFKKVFKKKKELKSKYEKRHRITSENHTYSDVNPYTPKTLFSKS